MSVSVKRAAIALAVATLLVVTSTPPVAVCTATMPPPSAPQAMSVTLKERIELCTRIKSARARLLCVAAALAAHGYQRGKQGGQEVVKRILLRLGFDCLADRLFRSDSADHADHAGPCVARPKHEKDEPTRH